ncbi:MAG: H-NS histone family protein [Thiotrichales bacterium]|nr:H-NS histone family protein [Thiotrichales bacterium]
MQNEEFIKIALHRKRLKAALKNISLTDLEKIISDLNEISAERAIEIAAQEAEIKQKQAKIEEMKALLSKEGLSLEDLMDSSSDDNGKNTASRSSVSPKYRLIDEQGHEHLWTGRGRAPKAFQAYLNQGHSKESLLIK